LASPKLFGTLIAAKPELWA